jgi:hypothetical protein
MPSSQARIAANRRNSLRSTGPKTESGKRASRLNGLTHGLTASTLILPSEKAADFERRMDEVCKVLQPRNEVERILVFSTVRASWLLGRADRVQTARIAAIIESAPDREQEETYELGKRLFFNNNGPLQTWGVLHYNFTTPRTSYSGQPVHPDDPDTLVRKLCKTASGCRWMLDEWARLRALVEPGNSWQAMDKFKATRLLSRQPADCIWDRTIAELWLRTWTINPRRETAWVELKSEMSSEEYRNVRKTITWMWPDMLDSNDQQTERQIVIAIIDRAVEEIKAKAAIVAERAERDAKRLADCLSFDDSDEGDRIRKYEQAHQRTMFRSLRELYKTRAETEEVEPSYFEDPGEGGEAPDATNAPDPAYLRSREHSLVRSAEGCDECGDFSSKHPAHDRHGVPDHWQDPQFEPQRPTPDERYDPEEEFQRPITDNPYNPPAAEASADLGIAARSGSGNEPARPNGAAIELLLSLLLLLSCATLSAGSTRPAAQSPERASSDWPSVARVGGNVAAIVASRRNQNHGPKATCQFGSAESRGANEKSEGCSKSALMRGRNSSSVRKDQTVLPQERMPRVAWLGSNALGATQVEPYRSLEEDCERRSGVKTAKDPALEASIARQPSHENYFVSEDQDCPRYIEQEATAHTFGRGRGCDDQEHRRQEIGNVHQQPALDCRSALKENSAAGHLNRQAFAGDSALLLDVHPAVESSARSHITAAAIATDGVALCSELKRAARDGRDLSPHPAIAQEDDAAICLARARCHHLGDGHGMGDRCEYTTHQSVDDE